MIFKVLNIIVFFGLLKCYGCNELKLKIEDLFVDFVNYTYINEETFLIDIDYETDTKSVMNLRIDIIEDIPKDVTVKLKVWGRAFGQYSVPTGINFDVKLCQGTLLDVLRPYMEQAGMSEACPPSKGNYEGRRITTELVGLPISVLPGLHFLVETELYSANIIIMKLRSYIYVR